MDDSVSFKWLFKQTSGHLPRDRLCLPWKDEMKNTLSARKIENLKKCIFKKIFQSLVFVNKYHEGISRFMVEYVQTGMELRKFDKFYEICNLIA